VPELTRLRSLSAELAALRSGELSATDAVARSCDRIEAVDELIRAFLPEPGRRERLAARVATLTADASPPADRPPLYGVPVAVKDIVHVAGLPTRAGSRLPAEALAGPQAPVVDRLVEAGAVVVGKTVTAEFAVVAPGPTRNPRRPAHTPGGSSSGSAAAVAAGMVPLAVGTQTIGSVVRPAAYCGVTGYKPSHGRVPGAGVIANAPTFDTVGVFVATPLDLLPAAAVLLDDWRPPSAPPTEPPVLGVPDAAYLRHADAVALAHFERQLETLRRRGFAVRRTGFLADFDTVRADQFVINRFELARGHRAWFAAHAPLYRPETAAAIREGQPIEPAAYRAALRARAALRTRLAEATAEHGVDVWVAPAATGPAPRGLGSTGNPVMSLPWSHLGAPALSFPAGRFPDGLPAGLQCAGPVGGDEDLLPHAAAVAQALTRHPDSGRPPR
jgi:Asp-tRNA(Asn)/Glu-tRNA(Gln) amidotransferase A subunit family amidase